MNRLVCFSGGCGLDLGHEPMDDDRSGGDDVEQRGFAAGGDGGGV